MVQGCVLEGGFGSGDVSEAEWAIIGPLVPPERGTQGAADV